MARKLHHTHVPQDDFHIPMWGLYLAFLAIIVLAFVYWYMLTGG